MFRKKPQPPVRRRVDLSQPPRRHIEPENAAQTFVRRRTIANVAELGREEIQTQRQRAQKFRARRRRLGTVLLILLILIIAALAL
ncbi:MAG: hypothetical protein LBM73_00770, partial [Candidatus Nomurabacteria bacterium]|nr:hypothetical protein [Candidatus Nomurabacteria bacterium]